MRFWRRATFPEAHASSILAADAFHGRVRDGNGWFHVAIPPESEANDARAPSPSLSKSVLPLDNCTALPSLWGQALDRLVPLGSRHYCPSTCGLSTTCSAWGLTWLSSGGIHLQVGFKLRCFQLLSAPDTATGHMPLARQPVHWRSVRPGPLVLRTAPVNSPAPIPDMDRTVSRRSEPSSRTALMGEQPNPWDVLPPQVATSRHRGAKPPRRCGLLGEISLLSPG